MASWRKIRLAVRVSTSVTTWRNPSISLRCLVPPDVGGSLWTLTSIVPASIVSSSSAARVVLFLRDVGRGSGVGSGVEKTSEADSSSCWSSSWVEDDEGSDFRDLLAGVGRVSRARDLRFVTAVDAFGEDNTSSASGVTSGGSID